MDSFQGKKLNAPNDIVVHSDGAIWFTDPGYGIVGNYEGGKAAFELPENATRGAISLDGQMVERLHADMARRTVAIAEAIATPSTSP